MDDDIRQRVRLVLAWLKENRFILSQKDAAKRMGYNHCAVSTILNGDGKISNRFVQKLSSVAPGINAEWIMTGKGEMVMRNNNIIEDNNVLTEERLDISSLIKIIEGQTKVISFITDYLQKIEITNNDIRNEIELLRIEIAQIKKHI